MPPDLGYPPQSIFGTFPYLRFCMIVQIFKIEATLLYFVKQSSVASRSKAVFKLGTVWKYLQFFLFVVQENRSRLPPPPSYFPQVIPHFFPNPPPPPKFSSSLSQVFKSNFYLFIESKKSIIMLFLPAVLLYSPYLLLQKSFPLGILDYIPNNRVNKQSQIQIRWQMTSISPLWALYTYIANSHLNLVFE